MNVRVHLYYLPISADVIGFSGQRSYCSKLVFLVGWCELEDTQLLVCVDLLNILVEILPLVEISWHVKKF